MEGVTPGEFTGDQRTTDQANGDVGFVPFDPDRYLGTVTQIGGTSLEFVFDYETNQSTGATRNLSYRASVGDHLIIKVGHFGILGQMIEVKTPDTSLATALSGNGKLTFAPPIGCVQFANSLDGKTGLVIPGIAKMPRIHCQVYVAESGVVQLAAEANLRKEGHAKPLVLNLASLPDRQSTKLRFTPESLFGRHCAVLGTTGGGKSWSLAKLVEETAKLRSKTILFDATGEFSTLTEGTLHLYLGNHPNPPQNSREVVVPYYELTERDLFAIFKPKGQNQAPKLRAAIKSLKLSGLCPELALDGTIMKANRSKREFQMAYKKYYQQVEDPHGAFDIKHLSRQIEHECVRPNRSEMEPQFWGDISAVDHSQCISLINRVKDITTSLNLSPIFNPFGKASLLKAIDAFVKDKDSRVLCISLQYLSFAHNAREIIANALGRHLMGLAQAGGFREKPMLFVVDEAHQFFNKELTDIDGDYPLDAFSLIAKEGRKYALSICLATQRPRDIPEGVLSQMGTLIVHRLINDLDRGVVERACGEMNRSCLDALPGLAPGEAIILGAGFPMPIYVRVDPPFCPPNSMGADFQTRWR